MKEYDDIFDILLKCAAEVDMKYWEAGAPDICEPLCCVGLFQPLYISLWFFIRVKNSLKFPVFVLTRVSNELLTNSRVCRDYFTLYIFAKFFLYI